MYIVNQSFYMQASMGSQTVKHEIFKAIQHLVKDTDHLSKYFLSNIISIKISSIYTVLATDVYITSSSEQLISTNINIFTLGDYIMNSVDNQYSCLFITI